MSLFLANLAVNLVSLSCIGIAGYLAVNDKQGWGWFLVIGFICGKFIGGRKCKEP